MAINKKLIHFNKKESFNTELANNNILNTSIVFIKDSKEIWTHGQLYATQLTTAEIEAIVANSPSVEDVLAQIAAEVTARDKAVMAEKHRAEQAEAALSSAIESEIARSTAKDEAHTAAINKEVQDRTNAIATEVTNRDAAIEVETNRALDAERTLQTNINSANTAISNEVARATEAEQLIQTNLTTEINRAKAAEQSLDSKITDHTNITDTALALKADKSDTYTKSQVDQKVSGLYKVNGSSTFEDLPKTNAVGDTYNITNSFTLNEVVYPAGTNIVYTGNGWDALSGVFDTTALEGSIQTVADNLTKEAVRAKEAESALSTSIANEVTNRTQADTAMQSNITTLTNKVNANEIKLSTIQGDYKTEGSINKALEDAKAYTNSVVSGLDSTITGSSKNVTVSVTEADGKLFNITVNQNDGDGSGLDADLLDGKHDGELTAQYFSRGEILTNADTINKLMSGVYCYINGNNPTGAIGDNGVLLSFRNKNRNDMFQMVSDSNGKILYYRGASNIGYQTEQWSEWRQIAFTDSNVASATKLQTPRTIWGQFFDGMGNVDGRFKQSLTTSTGNVESFIIETNDIDTNFGVTNFKVKTIASAGESDSYYTTSLSLNAKNGNVGVRTTNPAYELDVNGNVSGDFVDWYGVSWSENDSSPTCTRIGNMAMHKSLPIQSAMKGYVIYNTHGGSPYLDCVVPFTQDWSKIEFTATTNNQTSGATVWEGTNTMVKIPEFWYIDEYYGPTKTHNLKISQTAKAGWNHHKEAYVGAYEGWLSDDCYHSRSGVIPTINLDRETARVRARANGFEGESKWNIYTYEEHRAICHLFLVEYATRNCQAAVNSALTAEGFRQGGLGTGCTTGTVNGAYSFIPTGTTNSLGNGSGQVAYTASNGVTYYANRYRGIENPFGHIWKNVDDIINVYNADITYKTVYKCNKPEHFATNKNAKYKPLCSFPGGSKMQGWSKEIKATINCDFFKYSVGGGESTYWCDYNYDAGDTSEHCLLIGGTSGTGGQTGLFLFALDTGVGYSSVNVGSRLTYLPWAE